MKGRAMMQNGIRKNRVIGLLLSLGLVVGAAVLAGPAQAQTIANGPYYAMPSWDQTLPSATRFIVLSNFNSQAVLDRETGLVWERSPQTTAEGWSSARFTCANKTVGNRKGWRLPSMPELASLIDPTQLRPALPLLHPFTNVLPASYWSATTSAEVPTNAWFVDVYFDDVSNNVKTTSRQVWCVRGGMNAEAY
jgi:Protein of unknown function (DUF1566)